MQRPLLPTPAECAGGLGIAMLFLRSSRRSKAGSRRGVVFRPEMCQTNRTQNCVEGFDLARVGEKAPAYVKQFLGLKYGIV